jgi:hypothetical protein
VRPAAGAALALLERMGDIDVLVADAALPASGRLEGFSQERSAVRCGSTLSRPCE